MKKSILVIILLMEVLSSCTMETFFKMGIKMPSRFSRYADKCFSQVKEPYDVIIVPGIPYNTASASSIMKIRIHWAKYLYDHGYARNIIFSGAAVHSPFIEGIVMKAIADSLGIPSDHTFFEVHAEHSTENIYYSWKMAKEMGFTQIAVATDPFQSYVLRGFIKEHCPEVASVPVVYNKIKTTLEALPAIDLTIASVDNFVPLADRENLARRIHGRRKDEDVWPAQSMGFLTIYGLSWARE